MTVRNIFCGQSARAGTLSYFTSVSTTYSSLTYGTSTSVTIPESTMVDDIAVVSISVTRTDYYNPAPPSITTPAGYTVVNSVDSSNTATNDDTRTSCFIKPIKSEDIGATLTITHGEADIRTILVLIFRYSGSSLNLAVPMVNSFGSQGRSLVTPPNQIVTASATSKPCAVIAVYAFSGSRVFTASPRVDLASGPLSVYHRIYNSSPSNVTVGCTPSPTGSDTVTMQSFYFTVS